MENDNRPSTPNSSVLRSELKNQQARLADDEDALTMWHVDQEEDFYNRERDLSNQVSVYKKKFEEIELEKIELNIQFEELNLRQDVLERYEKNILERQYKYNITQSTLKEMQDELKKYTKLNKDLEKTISHCKYVFNAYVHGCSAKYNKFAKQEAFNAFKTNAQTKILVKNIKKLDDTQDQYTSLIMESETLKNTLDTTVSGITQRTYFSVVALATAVAVGVCYYAFKIE